MKVAQYLICFGALILSGCSNACEEAFAKWNTNESTAAILLSTGKDDDAHVANYSAKFAAEANKRRSLYVLPTNMPTGF